MTAREIYEYALIEINKLKAPNLLLEDYNYYINKAIQQYINKSYSKFEINQQSTDDLRALTTTCVAKVPESMSEVEIDRGYRTVELPLDYMHILSCTVKMVKTNGCTGESNATYLPVIKMTSDMLPALMINAYMKPSEKRPYYRIIGQDDNITGKTMDSYIRDSNNSDKKSLAYDRTSNITPVKLNIWCGKSTTTVPETVYVDYVKSPMRIVLTRAQIKSIADTSQALEFSDYVSLEIVNEFTKLLLENASDQRLQSNIAVNQSIPSVMMGNVKS